MNERRQLLESLRTLLGGEALLEDVAACRVYSQDSSHLQLGLPWVVALPDTTEKLAAVVTLCAENSVPVVCRGSGTGLSGGAVPVDGALVLGTARLNGASAVLPDQQTIEVEVGILNDRVSRLAGAFGLHFAPDPSSQSIATIGGNIAENAGGPHCLRYGVTLQHLRSLRWVDSTGRPWLTGRGLPAERGLDLVSLLCGSEGTLGVVTEAKLNLVENAEDVVTLLAFFPDLNEATESVVTLLREGLLPVAVEMVDQAMLGAVEQAFHFGFPTDVQAAMIAEFTGSAEEVAEDVPRAVELLLKAGAREVKQAREEKERLELWKCRKKAFGAVGRLTPRYVTMDVVVPLGSLPELVRQIQVIKARHGVEISTAFHAGDGNLHPGVHYDDQIQGDEERAHRAADEIIRFALELDGSATGEHGVGLEKKHVLPWQWDAQTDRLSREIKNIFDAGNYLNPGKLLPDPEAAFAPCKALPESTSFRFDSMTVTAPEHTLLADIQNEALARGLCLPVGAFGVAEAGSLGLGRATTVGDLVAGLLPGPAAVAMGTARDYLLELWAHTGDGRLFHSGAPVFKNVAGYSLIQCLCGSGRHFVHPAAATFQLKPASEAVLVQTFEYDEFNAKFLDALWRRLPRQDVAASTLIFDGPRKQLTALVAGRLRPWGLPTLSESLQGSWPGCRVVQKQSVPLNQLADLLESEQLPGWARSSGQWNLWAPLGDDSSQGPEQPPLARWIWQSQPGLWWSPDQETSADGWFVDEFFRAGKVTAIPAPVCGVPRHLLRACKSLFDPEGVLESIPWLQDKGGRDEP